MADSVSLSFNGEKPGLKKITVVVSNVLIRYRLSVNSILLKLLLKVNVKENTQQSGKNLLSEESCSLVLV